MRLVIIKFNIGNCKNHNKIVLMVKRRDLWGRRLSLIKKTAWEGSWMTKKDYVLQLFLFSSFSFSFSPSSSLFFSERTIHLSQMNTNAMPDYRRKRWRIGVHEKRPNKPISISWYRIILALAKYHVKKSLQSLSSPLSKRRRTFVKIHILWLEW